MSTCLSFVNFQEKLTSTSLSLCACEASFSACCVIGAECTFCVNTNHTSSVAGCFQELALAPNRRLEKLVPEDSRRQECPDLELGYPSHCSMLGVIFGRDPQERRPLDSGLPLLVKWHQRLPLWSRPNVPNSGRCVYDHRP
jgi:hypothetical protein